MSTARRSAPREASVAASPLRWLTHIAFVIAVAVIIARLTTTDGLRDPEEAVPGGLPHAGPGPASALALDLIAMVPAMLVLARRSIDAKFRLALRWSHLPLFALAGWAAVSTAWASDKFAAAVTSAHLVAAACLLWALSQLVRSPVRLRIVAAVCFGLLLVIFVQALMYRRIDVPQDISFFNANKDSILKSHNLIPDSFGARQFEMKVTKGELQVYFVSANTVAAVALLLFTTCIGIGILKITGADFARWVALPAAAVGALIYVLIAAASKTSFFTPMVFIGAVAAVVIYRPILREHFRVAFCYGVAVVALSIAALVAHGIHHGGLFPGHLSSSLDFRWKYWIASTRIFETHPLIGIGWNNFGLHYLAHRVPEATEAIKDPHNFLVHFFVELGAIGGLLSIIWLLRSAWELTSPGESPARSNDEVNPTIRSVVAILISGWLLSVLFSTEFSHEFIDVLVLLLKPVFLLLVLLLATIAACMRSPRSWLLDDRTGPWIFICYVTGLGLFLLHNFIDFSMFEAGPLFLFMGLTGSLQGMAPTPEMNPKPRARVVAITATCLLTIGWLTAAFAFVGPIVAAEQSANDANESIQTADVKSPADYARHFRRAIDDLRSATQAVPYNSDYAYRLARLLIGVGLDTQAAEMLARVRQMNPRLADAWQLDAQFQLRRQNPDQAAVIRDYEKLLELSPNDMPTRIEYGKALVQFGQIAKAREQFKQALSIDAKLPAGEPNRLSTAQLDELHAALH